MSLRSKFVAGAAAAGLAATTMAVAAPAASADEALGTTSLAEALGVVPGSGPDFDRNPYDFDLVTAAIETVLEVKPNSPVGLLANGSAAATAFIPNDRAFQQLARDLDRANKWKYGFFRVNEKRVFNFVASLGVDTVETVLLYHVVPDATIDKKAAKGADGAQLATAQGGTIEVDVRSKKWNIIRLIDNDPNDRDPYIVRSKFDINKGNMQIAHGISQVLRPIDL